MRKPTRILSALIIGLIATADVAAAPKAADVQDVVILTPNRPIFVRLNVTVDGKPIHQAWDDFFKFLFDFLDVDKDGKLNAQERKRVPAPSSLFTIHDPYAYRFALDVTGVPPAPRAPSPALTTKPLILKDLVDYYRSHGVAPLRVAGRMAAINLKASIDPVYTGLLPGASGPTAEALTNAFMRLLDTDRDGRLSPKELRASESSLLKRDFDEDEILTMPESVGDLNNRNPLYAVPSSSGWVAPPMKPALGHLVVTVLMGTPSSVLAEMLLKAYSPNPKTKVAALSRADLELEKSIFAKLDANKDGKLDASELSKFAMRKPDSEMKLDVGKKPKIAVSSSGEGSPAPPSGVRIVKDKRVELSSVSLRFSVGASASNNGGGYAFTSPQHRKNIFESLDRDKNGYLDLMEVRGNAVFNNSFSLIDTDNNKMAYLKEIEAYFVKWQALQTKAQSATVSLSLFEEGQGFFGLLDGNNDGRLSVREMRQAPALLAKHDGNKDGQLSKSEIRLRYHVSLAKGASVNAQFWYPQEGRYIARARPAVKPGTVAKTPLWFRKMDRNHDGDVSIREFVGNDAAFAKMDTDGDRLLSAAEAMKADAELRK